MKIMWRKLCFIVFIFFTFVLILNYSFSLTCSLYSGSCPANYVCLFSQYQENNSHVGSCDYYNYKFCCQDPYLKVAEVREGCGPGEFSALDLYEPNNSHVSSSGNGSLILSLSFEEGSGDKVFDSSGYGHHGVLYNEPIWVDGKFGKALKFDGVDDYILIDGMDDFYRKPFTIVFWFNTTESGTTWEKVFMSQQNKFAVFLNRDNRLVSVRGYVSGTWSVLAETTTSVFEFNRWNQLLIVWDGSKYAIYINGELMPLSTSTSNIADPGTSGYKIGLGGINSETYNGTLDEFRIYDRALTNEEIKALYFQKVCTYAPMRCYLRSFCQAGETGLISLYQPYNSHVGNINYYSYKLCCRIEKQPPQYLSYGQNTSIILPGHAILLYSEWKDNGNLSYAILSTNETGQWKNYTDGTYNSPLYLNHFWTFANFTWQNPSVSSGTIVGWRIYANDSAGNWNVTPLQTFKVGSAISLEDTTGTIPLKGWGEQFTFKVNVSNSNGYTTNVTLWKAYSASGPWYYVDSQNCTNCLQETQLTFSDHYFTCEDFVNSGGILYYKFNATDYKGSYNETNPTSFNTEKDDVSVTITAGDNSEVDRYGTSSVLLQVRIKDTDRNEYLPSGRNCSIYVDNKNLPNQTDSNGYCSINFDPDCSYSVGPSIWLGGTNSSDVCYKPLNSTSSTVTIYGQLFNNLESPPDKSVFNNGDLVNITGDVSSDCSDEGLITGATVGFAVKLNSSMTWEECSPVDENNGWYNCTWNSTGKTGGWYDIRFNSTKTYYRPDYAYFYKRFYLNPLIQILISEKLSEGIFFTNLTGSIQNKQYPISNMKVWNNATWNYNQSDPNKATAYWIKNTGTNPEDICIKADSDLICSSGACAGNSISTDNIAWSNSTSSDPPFNTEKRLSLNYVKIAYNVQPDQIVYFRFWLNPEPDNLPSGVYNTTYSIKAVEAGENC